jgi:hypothetical protein
MGAPRDEKTAGSSDGGTTPASVDQFEDANEMSAWKAYWVSIVEEAGVRLAMMKTD